MDRLHIDDTPLSFGKFKGKTPQELYRDRKYKYLIWLAENVDFNLMSSRLLGAAVDMVGVQKHLRNELEGLGVGDVEWYK